MRAYPRRVYKTQDDSKKVFDEFEEIEASKEGYECHFDKQVIESAKGTDFEILRELIKGRKLEIQNTEEKPEIVVLKEVKKRKGK
jgi:hypothetical protein